MKLFYLRHVLGSGPGYGHAEPRRFLPHGALPALARIAPVERIRNLMWQQLRTAGFLLAVSGLGQRLQFDTIVPKHVSSSYAACACPFSNPQLCSTAVFLWHRTCGGLARVHLRRSLSQRCHFASILAHRCPNLSTIVHDDSCHLKLMCLDRKASLRIAARLAGINFIVDRFHAAADVGEFCSRHCLPALPANEKILLLQQITNPRGILANHTRAVNPSCPSAANCKPIFYKKESSLRRTSGAVSYRACRKYGDTK